MAFSEWKNALNSAIHHAAETTPPPLFLVQLDVDEEISPPLLFR